MLAHAQLSVLALAALVACAAARPDTSYHAKPNYPTKGGLIPKTANAVQILEDPLTDGGKSKGTPVQAAEPQATNLLPGNQNVAVANLPPPLPNPLPPTQPPPKPKDERVTAPRFDEVPELFRYDTKPVNKRYPHAVLFGGTCGGSIIHPKWVLTAGHCTLFTGGRYVLAGTNNSDDGSGITKKVKKLHIHPLFSVGPYWLNADNYGIKQVAARWDFLLAELEEPFELDGINLAAISLDDQPIIAPKTYVGYAGYGTDHHGGFMRSAMHAMHLQTQPDSVCRLALEQYRNKDMICAKGYEPNFDSACNGDSGSGLVDGSRLVGIASWVQNDAFECAKGNLVVFSKVAAARDWIRRIANV